MKRNWDKLTCAQQDLFLTLLWRDGHSEKAIADFLRATKGTVVRRRHTLKLVSEGRPGAKQAVDPERFRDLLDLHAMEQTAKRGVVPATPPRYKLAVSEAVQCEHQESGMRCAFEHTHVSLLGRKTCALHA